MYCEVLNSFNLNSQHRVIKMYLLNEIRKWRQGCYITLRIEADGLHFMVILNWFYWIQNYFTKIFLLMNKLCNLICILSVLRISCRILKIGISLKSWLKKFLLFFKITLIMLSKIYYKRLQDCRISTSPC